MIDIVFDRERLVAAGLFKMDNIDNGTLSNVATTMPTLLKLRSQPWTTSGGEFIAAIVCLGKYSDLKV